MDLYGTLATGFRSDLTAPWIELPDGRTLPYRSAEEGSAKVAGLLRSLGVMPGDRVAVQVDKTPEALLLYLGTVRAGAVFLPLNPAYRAEEVAYFLGDAEPAVAVGRPEVAREFEAAASASRVRHVFVLGADGRGSWAEAVGAASPVHDDAPVGESDLASIVYTSGTTGRAKGAMLTHRNLVSNAVTLHTLWGFRSGDVLLHALPIFHVHGLYVATNTAMLNASRIRFQERFDAHEVVEALAGSTVFMGVPTMYTRLLAQPGLTRERCAGVRLFVSGSAPLLPETFERFRERTGHTILERYGMTETGMSTSNPWRGERRAGTVGRPLTGVEVRVVGKDGRPLLAGQVGDVQVRGPNVMPGYWRRPETNVEEFTADGFFRTGDLGVFDTDGYLTLVGRSKDLVISGGLNVYPKEIELLLDALPGVVESAVIGVAHPDLGEGVTAVLVLKAGAQVREAEVLAALRPRLAAFKLPKAVRLVDELPRNAMGKVQKHLLRERFAGLYR
ncbi:MAG TPA: malonyl-CoA synthase [Deltaproteobacteria bacterium]|jgi:malonyl-CoA/methylmalonyl-CoA synthetase|nr:malonyl-CoA synthase [Deltaproteobacteria bacterium]